MSTLVFLQSNENEKNDVNFMKLEMILSKLSLKNDLVSYNNSLKIFSIENKYYKCSLDLKPIKFKILDDFLNHNKNIEGIILFSDIIQANNIEEIKGIFSKFKNNGFFTTNFLCLMIFKESLDDLESMVKMDELRDICFDFNIEIISNIFNYKPNEGKINYSDFIIR